MTQNIQVYAFIAAFSSVNKFQRFYSIFECDRGTASMKREISRDITVPLVSKFKKVIS